MTFEIPTARRMLACAACLVAFATLATLAATSPAWSDQSAASSAAAPVVITDADVQAHIFAPVVMDAAMQGPRMRGDEGYNSDYLFGLTRAVRDSTVSPAFKPLAWIFTIPLDLAFLPFAAIGGLFG